jgi:hypothetical protein
MVVVLAGTVYKVALDVPGLFAYNFFGVVAIN